MSSTIEFTLSTPCPAHRDAILSWVVEGSESPSAVAAAEHVKKCVACREFRDSLKMQRALVKAGAGTLGRDQSLTLAPRRDFAGWVGKLLLSKSDRAFAHSLWYCAQALFRRDPAVARRVHHEVYEEGRRIDVPSTLEDLASIVLRNPLARPGHDANRRLGMTAHALADLVDTSGADGRNDARYQIICELLDAAESVSASIVAQTSTIRAYSAWYGYVEGEVPGLFERAIARAPTAKALSHALGNMSLWHSSNGNRDLAIQLAEDSIRVWEGVVFSRANLVIWLAAVGDERGAAHQLQEAIAREGAVGFWNRWPWSVQLESMHGFLDGVHAPETERLTAIRRLSRVLGFRGATRSDATPTQRLMKSDSGAGDSL